MSLKGVYTKALLPTFRSVDRRPHRYCFRTVITASALYMICSEDFSRLGHDLELENPTSVFEFSEKLAYRIDRNLRSENGSVSLELDL